MPALARRLGIVVQSLVVGALVALAVWHLLLLSSGGRVFRYQGF